jgi:hypothetical protein
MEEGGHGVLQGLYPVDENLFSTMRSKYTLLKIR